MEQWKDIKNYEGMYQVSNYGRVRSLDRYTKTKIKYNDKVLKKGKILKQNKKRNGYLTVDLSKDNVIKTVSVHRLVAIAFIDNEENKEQVNHINANKQDNRVENLEWCTGAENRKHAKENNLYKAPTKPIRCKQLNIVFNSSYEAGEYINEHNFKYSKNVKGLASKIRSCANGYQKTAYGYTWEKI